MTTSTSPPPTFPPTPPSPSASPRPGTLARARAALLDLFFPPRCAGCGRRDHWLCAACLAKVAPLAPPLCARCGRPLATASPLCAGCRAGELAALDWARAAYPFVGPLRAAIHRFKYEGERARAAHLGAFLLPLLAASPGGTRLVPVPLSADRRRARGYNQAEELARVLAAGTGLPLDLALVRTRDTRPQVGLDRAARRRNVLGAFSWQGAPLVGAAIVLVDDVLTTGATAAACAEALRAAGAGRVGLLTVARAAGRPAGGANTEERA